MAGPTMNISYPGSYSTVGQTFYVQGTCSMNHTVTVVLLNASDNSPTTYSKQATPNSGSWSVAFSDVAKGVYNIKMSCGEPVVSVESDRVTVA